MSNVLTHRFTSPKLDGADATQVQPSAWNDGHRFIGGADGDVLTRATADATYGAVWATPTAVENWTPYVPTWYVNNSVQALGTHSFNSATYFRRGNACWFQIHFVVGSGAIPAGLWHFTMPFPAKLHLSPGGGVYLPAGGQMYQLALQWASSTALVVLYHTTAATFANLTTTAPVAMGVNSQLELRGNYEVAPGSFLKADEPLPERTAFAAGAP